MASSDVCRQILSNGYFPAELPPVFDTRTFGAHAGNLIGDWFSKGLIGTKKIRQRPGHFTYKCPEAEPERLSMPKRGYERRIIHVTHPIPQGLLAHEISNNLATISKWLSRNVFSVDTVKFASSHPKGVPDINFKAHNTKKDFIENSSDWLVKTDISRFYPSIYTHSIAWAAYGKERVKNNRTMFSGSLADRIDQLVRLCNRNQTVGIPIGPTTSRVIAEIISCAIDQSVHSYEGFDGVSAIDRLQDDWYIGCKSLDQSEATLASLSYAYRQYDLEINGVKTSIDHISSRTRQGWQSEISQFLRRSNKNVQGSVLRDFLDLVLSLHAQQPQENVIPYSLSVMEEIIISPKDVSTVESFLLRCCAISPSSLDRICRLLINIQHETQSVAKHRIRQRLVPLAEKHMEQGNHFELIWLLYTLRGLKAPFSSPTISRLSTHMNSAVIPLLLLDMRDRGILLTNLPTETWEEYGRKERVEKDWTWLLVYEGIRNGWLQDKYGIMKNPFLASLSAHGVYFYDRNRNVPSRKRLIRNKKTSRIGTAELVRKIRAHLRGRGGIGGAYI